MTLKDFIHQFHYKGKLFYLKERHKNNNLDLANKNFFFNNYTVDIFLFVTAIILLMVTTIVMSTTLVTSVVLQQIKDVGEVAKQEHISIAQDIECTCKIQWYTILMQRLLILEIVIFIILKLWNLKLFRGHLFSNAVKIMLFISDAQYYVPVKFCSTAGSIHLFKIMGKLPPENVKFKRNILWGIMELDWKDINVTLNGNKINLPTSITIRFKNKFKIRCIVKRNTLFFHIMLKQGMTWFTLASNNPQERV